MIPTNTAQDTAKTLEGEVKRLVRPGVSVEVRHHRCDSGAIIYKLRLDGEEGSLTHDYLETQRRTDGYERWLREFARRILRETGRPDRERLEVQSGAGGGRDGS